MDVVRRRGIEEIVHFTTNVGLLGILDSGQLKSRHRVSDDERLEFVLELNTPLVKDAQWIDYANLSITSINTGLFNISSTRWHPDLAWYILAFDPEILSHDGVVFATTNNIYPSVLRGEGPEALEALFAEHVVGRYNEVYRRRDSMPSNQPTDPQAEVLYPAAVSTEHLTRIYAARGVDQDNAQGQIAALEHPPVDVVVDPSRFRSQRQ